MKFPAWWWSVAYKCPVRAAGPRETTSGPPPIPHDGLVFDEDQEAARDLLEVEWMVRLVEKQ
jgi:hypothetical protein